MEAITFKKQGILFYLHKILFNKDPEDTCTYKFELILSSLTAIVTIHATIFRIIIFLVPSWRKNKDSYGFKSHLLCLLLAALTLLVGHAIMENANIIPDFINWHTLSSSLTMFMYSLSTLLIGTVLCAIGLTAIILLIAIGYFTWKGIEWTYNKIRSVLPSTTNPITGEPNTQVGVLYVSWKDKLCKRITWE